MPRAISVIAVLLCLLSALAGCRDEFRPEAGSPAAVADSFYAHLVRQETAQAARHVDADTLCHGRKVELTAEEAGSLCEERLLTYLQGDLPHTYKVNGEQLQGDTARVAVTATPAFAGGSNLVLIRRKGHWKIVL